MKLSKHTYEHLNQLASSHDRRDEVPNQELARKIIKSKDKKAIQELVNNLKNKNKDIQADCIKVLYEVGAEQPALIKEYLDDFTALINSKNNRLAWGGMSAINSITGEVPDAVYKLLPRLIDAANAGSVITRDNLVSILIKLEGEKKYQGKVFPLLIEQLTTCPTNQLPMYAENGLPVVTNKNKASFISILQQRLPEVVSESKRNRILKIIRRIAKANRYGEIASKGRCML